MPSSNQAFIQAATWPDDVKHGTSANFNSVVNTLNHTFSLTGVSTAEKSRCKSWHYKDLPIVPDPNNSNLFIAGSQTTHPAPASNAVKALKNFLFDRLKPIAQSAGSDQANMAVFLFFTEHIVGDLHQPLHCVSLFSTEFPDGDQGGNLIHFSDSELHAYWDNGPNHAITADPSLSGLDEMAVAQAWLTDPTIQPTGTDVANLDPNSWTTKGRSLAIQSAYNNRPPMSTSGYKSQHIDTCKRQLVLAGRRLAAILQRELG